MPDETTRTVTVDGVTWMRGPDGLWGEPFPPPPRMDAQDFDPWIDRQHNHALDRIAALEAEREEIEAALQVLSMNDRVLTRWPKGWLVSYEYDEPGGPYGDTALAALLGWHRARGATPRHTEGRDNNG